MISKDLEITSVIKDNFVAPKSEIETLQTNTAKLNASNNFPR